MIELLESRIAPAAIVHYTETDGDHVTIKVSKGTQAQLETALGFSDGATGIDKATLNLTDSSISIGTYQNANISIKATNGGGDGLANQIKINAFNETGSHNVDLHNVRVKGDLIYIDAGDADLTTNAINKLVVTNFVKEIGDSNATSSQLEGNVGTIIVKGNMSGYLKSQETANGTDGTVINKLVIKGEMTPSGGDYTGYIHVNRINNLFINEFVGSSFSTNNGVILVHSLGKMTIKKSTSFARVELE